jgi:hypothetical protein
MNLRAQYFEQLEAILADLAGLINRNEKLALHNIYVKRVVVGLKRIKKEVRRIVEYSADDQLYWQIVGRAANHLNIVFNILRGGQLKEEVFGLYQRCCDILYKDLQLHLFEVGEEFGWSISVGDSEKPALKVFDVVRRFVNYCSERISVVSCQWWHSIQGKQLTFADWKRCQV